MDQSKAVIVFKNGAESERLAVVTVRAADCQHLRKFDPQDKTLYVAAIPHSPYIDSQFIELEHLRACAASGGLVKTGGSNGSGFLVEKSHGNYKIAYSPA